MNSSENKTPFSNWANKYDIGIREYFSNYDEMQEFILKKVLAFKPATLVDLGIGTGDFVCRLLSRNPNISIIGLDSESNMLDIARKRLERFTSQLTLKEEDIRNIKNYHNIDAVVSILTVHHLKGKEKKLLFKAIYRVLNPGGIFIIGDIMLPENGAMRMDCDPETDFPDKFSEHELWLKKIGFLITDYCHNQDVYVIIANK